MKYNDLALLSASVEAEVNTKIGNSLSNYYNDKIVNCLIMYSITEPFQTLVYGLISAIFKCGNTSDYLK